MADPNSINTTDLIGTLTNLTGPGALALVVVALWRQWAVFGWLYRSVIKERDDLQVKYDALTAAYQEKVIPALIEANSTMQQLGALVQTDVSLRDPRRSQ